MLEITVDHKKIYFRNAKECKKTRRDKNVSCFKRKKKTKTGQTKINKQKRAGLDPSQCDLRFKYSLV